MWKRRSVRLLFVLCPASLLLFGCYNPDKIGNGQLGCSPTSTCPDNFYCASDHYCWRNGTGPDLAAPLDLAVDASPNDAAPDAPPAVEMAVDMTSVELAVDSGAADSAIDAHLFDASVLDLHPDAQSVDAAGDMARVDMTRLDMTACCASDSDCNGLRCFVSGSCGQCVRCLQDSDCPGTDHCDPVSHNCVPPCSGPGTCGDAGFCEADAGVCIACRADSDCTSPQTPRCDPAQRICVPCLPTNDNCAAGSYCAPVAGSWMCLAGCQSSCANGQTCCSHQCSNLATDANNCGACGQACATGLSCCSSSCTDATMDVNNCGGCGTACSVANGTPQCRFGNCAILSCDSGFADCDHLYNDGCEAQLNTAAHCGSCNNLCNVVNGTAACLSGGTCGIGSCNTGFGDCDHLYSTGCETNTSVDVQNCGGCGLICSGNNMATISCDAGSCDGACKTGFADCNNNKQIDGCERSVFTDPLNCGGCNQACSTNHVSNPSCSMGVCNGACDSGWGDCNNNLLKDGCETDVTSSLTNCGACNLACSNNNITAACTNGTCTGACNSGFADCNGNKQSDGCEVDTNTDPNNCGGCRLSCSNANATSVTCSAGQCVPACAAGFANCDNTARANGCNVDLISDVNNCGKCGTKCGTGQACINGSCQCTAANTQNCNGVCINTTNNVNNCGGCGLACSTVNMQTTVCSNSQCGGVCNSGFANCDNSTRTNGCNVDTTTSVAACGGCGMPCSTNNITPSCVASSCELGTCAAGWSDCNNTKRLDGCEIHTASDTSNCGGCGVTCSNNHISIPTCTNGTCNGACDPGWGDCNGNKQIDGCEHDLTTDLNNCGACGNACGAGMLCVSGVCTCSIGTNCSNVCVDTTSNVNDCGGCGVVCSNNNIAPLCSNSQCIGMCNSGFADCNNNKQKDGCEVDLNSDANNCGSCGAACSPQNITPTCTNGNCTGTCNTGFADCDNNLRVDGCEVNLNTDPNHCGACTNAACSVTNMATVTCGGGVCNGTCKPGYADCNGNKQTDGCEVNLNVDNNNCGACNNACPTGTACSGGVCKCSNGQTYCTNAGACVDTTSNVNDCGGCGLICSNTNIAVPVCTNSQCTGSCNAGFADCNNNKQVDGCETAITTITNCGGCGAACSNNNIAASCTNGSCEMGVCNAGFADCNSNKRLDGCETNTSSNPSACGGCGNVCSGNNQATVGCSNGQCTGSCLPGFADCNMNLLKDGCEANLGSDNNNCGTCGHACATGSSCMNGVCQCGVTGDTICGGSCVDTTTNASDCGGCGNVCSNNNIANPTCANSQCNGACNTGFADCNNNKLVDGCEIDVFTDVNNCGACAQSCSTQNIMRSCVGGVCSGACNTGFADCNNNKLTDGCEVDLTSDPNHCGACANACSTNNMATVTCAASICNGACQAGFADCNGNKLTDGCEVNTNTDNNNCGGCNKPCAAGLTCQNGVCTCTGTTCNNSCVNTATDVNNCGGCGMACSANDMATVSCAGGQCNGTCLTGFADCNMNLRTDGCEINTTNDVSNCGACNAACSTNNITRSCSSGSCEGGVCLGGFADCDANKRLNGCETNVAGDPNHCGGCTQVCSTNNMATVTCANAVCNGACLAGFADCNNNKLTDGCEQEVDNDPNHCGGCTNVCSMNHMASVSCTAGACSGACVSGFADCNNNKLTDGCETDIEGNPSDCGGCGNVCSSNNMATVTCTAGSCSGACVSGFGDCNNDKLTDGCESNLNTDVKNCGGCANACSSNNMATVTCGGGVCNGSCNPGFADCNGNKLSDGCEVNLNTDNNNCGACNNACPAFTNCMKGVCICTNGTTYCNYLSACIDTTSDAGNCGGCQQACSGQGMATLSCANGVCNGTCASGFADCNNDKLTDGCETNTNTVSNCGGCGVVCSNNHVSPSCPSGACTGTCQTGFGDCDNNLQSNGCETNLNTTLAHCGNCATACSGANVVNPACTNGVCTGTCASLFGDCNHTLVDGCETPLAADNNNCGACGNVCPANTTCTNGLCICNGGGGTYCGGSCINTTTDVNHCGGCNNVCSANNMATVTCAGSVCNGTCNSGFGDCNNNKLTDGCETNLSTSAANCGACGAACSTNNITAACSGANCTGACNSGFADCNSDKRTDGCETPVSSDPNHCGGCNNVCSTNNMATVTCGGGVCNGSCNANFGDCDGNKLTNGCETNLLTDVNHCGACSTPCSVNNITPSCTNGSCAGGVCTSGFADCNNNKQTDGCETNIASNVNACGGCGNVCSSNNMASVSCGGGVCNGACVLGWADCNGNKLTDGCEINIDTNPNNCGSCGAPCSTNNLVAPACQNGACVGTCATGYRNCNNDLRSDGCEVNIETDPNNCGNCNNVCQGTNMATRTCTNGQCSGTCLSGYANCDNSLQQNGCNVYLINNNNHCGSCGLACDTSVSKCVNTQCLLLNGEPCFVGSSCVSGFCVQGLCSPFP